MIKRLVYKMNNKFYNFILFLAVAFVFFNILKYEWYTKTTACDSITFEKMRKIDSLNETSSVNKNDGNLKKCPIHFDRLIGDLPINTTAFNETIIENMLVSQDIELGGKWTPKDCKPTTHVAILIPYRNREEHLKVFLLHMHPILARQEVSYKIYLIEPTADIKFNRGLLFNIGFVEANKDSNDLWECFAFHDVDLLPENDRNMYTCPQYPTHLAHRMNKYKYKQAYEDYFGGVTIMRKEHYIAANGYSNLYFGWGAEDDDHFYRLRRKSYPIIHQQLPLGKYFMHTHKREDVNPERKGTLKNGSLYYDVEGLNSIKYKVIDVIKHKLYTKILVYYNRTQLKNMQQYKTNSTLPPPPPPSSSRKTNAALTTIVKKDKDKSTQSRNLTSQSF